MTRRPYYLPLYLVAALLALPATSAMADPTASTITSPSDPARLFVDSQAPDSTVVFSVDGTTSGGSGNVDLNCYTADGVIHSFVPNLAVTANHFHADVTLADRRTAVFRVYGAGLYLKTDFPSLGVYGYTRWPTLRLITCTGDFDRQARTYLDNLVVSAHLRTA